MVFLATTCAIHPQVQPTPWFPPLCTRDEQCDWPLLCMCEVLGVAYCCAGRLIPIPVPVPSPASPGTIMLATQHRVHSAL